MALELTAQAEAKIWQEAEQFCPAMMSLDGTETVHWVPSVIGHGYSRAIELPPSVELQILNETFRQDTCIHGEENQHLVQFRVELSGIEDSSDHVLINAEQGYIGGSRIQRCLKTAFPGSQPLIGINIHLQPHLFSQFFGTPTGNLMPAFQFLVRENDWQRAFSPKTTPAIRAVTQQIINCALTGSLKQIYLQGKVFELIALQLAGVQDAPTDTDRACMKPDTIARIHYAAEILRSQVEQPPTQTELAKRVGVSDRTLRRGFQAIFGKTVCGYLVELRLLQAKQLLRQGNLTVVEVAQRTGYSNQGHFAAAFKRRFGLNPKQWAMGQQGNG